MEDHNAGKCYQGVSSDFGFYLNIPRRIILQMERIQHFFTALTQQWPSYKDQHKTTLESSNKNPAVRDNELLDSLTDDNAVFVCFHVSTQEKG